MATHGPAHDVPLPSQAGFFGAGMDPSVSIQATRTVKGWIIDLRGPAGPMSMLPGEARAMARALDAACDDVDRLA